MKKGELSMTMIVGAVIAIVILVVVLFLILRGNRDLSDTALCSSKRGECTENSCSKIITDENGEEIPCPNQGETCCSLT